MHPAPANWARQGGSKAAALFVFFTLVVTGAYSRPSAQQRPGAESSPPLMTAAPCPAGADHVCIETGAVRGTVADGVRSFKGIPFATPPVGNLRFRPPQPAARWDGIRAADQFGPVCPQMNGNAVVGSEDCLTVNVWTSARPSPSLSPVMVFLTGGGNFGSSGSNFDGSLMVQRSGVVFVTYNLRLGVLGFLAHPALDRERPEKISGNYGSLDQIAMLRWIQRNIRSFGGDPGRVFLFGTSAGGGNICALMTSPLATGLFHGASMQSSVPTGCEIPKLADVQQRVGVRVAEATKCSGEGDVAACFRGRSVDEIVLSLRGATDVFPRAFSPNVDGHVFPDQPIKLLQSKRFTPMPVIIGNTADETRAWLSSMTVADPATYADAVSRIFGAQPRDAILGRYPAATFPSPRAALEALTVDAYFNCASRRVANVLINAQDKPVYQYVFTHALQNDPGARASGASHTLESRFLFPWSANYKPSDQERQLHESMLLYWSRIALTGDPNGPGTVAWPRYHAATGAYLELATPSRARTASRKEQCNFWDGVTLPWPHL